jgi:hypothetical protein
MKVHNIEKNIPIPEEKLKVEPPWPQMKVGDSILLKAEEGESLDKMRTRLDRSSRHHGDTTGKRFKVTLDHENKGVRVLRTE